MRTIFPLLRVKTEDLTVERLAPDLVERGTADTHHQSTASPDELQCRHIATKPEPLLQCLDDLVRSVTDPVLVETLPGHVGIEYCADSFLVAVTEGTKIVKDDGLEILSTLGDHRRSPPIEPTPVDSER